MAIINSDIQIAKVLLEKGEVIGFPTETVYGLAGNALNIKAVTKIFEVKNRPKFDPLIVHTNNFEKVETFVQNIPKKARLLFEKFSPGPITILLEKKEIIPSLVTAGLNRVAIRIPNHTLALELLASLDFPLAAPSANPFGYVSPSTAQHVDNQLGKNIEFILDGGPANIGIESTIVGFEGQETIVYRKGGLAIEAIEDVVGKVKLNEHSSSNPAAPGMLKSHYAPNKKILHLKREANILPNSGAIVFRELVEGINSKNQLILSKTGNYAEAAQNLFSFLRQIEELDVEQVYLELLPEENLGRAINDRLRRALATD